MPERDESKLKEQVRKLPHRPGVYLMRDRLGQVIYVGKAKDLKKRVSTYFQPSRKLLIAQPKVRAMLDLIFSFETIEVRSESEALLLEGKLIKEYKPRYNTDFTDDKRFLMVKVDLRETLPRFRLTRNRTDSTGRYYGPFPHSGNLRQTLAELKRRFGILLGDAKPMQLPDGRWRLYDDMRADINDHPNEVDEAGYRERVDAACEFLNGKAKEWLADIRKEMQAAAEKQQFERAASLRDLVFALERTTARTRKFTRNLTHVDDHGRTLLALQKALALARPPERMECFDISHISGTYCVASMVSFLQGKSDRKAYRRFKIRSFVGNDDFRAMEEVVGRRYRRLHEEGRPFPDLVVIDGGKGQVAAALKAFLILDLEPPAIIGLAKKQETIIFPDERPPLNLEHRSPELRLLMQLRDEAHRFANTFNADLRSQRLRESILDDFPAFGPKKKAQVLAHFGSIEKLRQAEVEAIAEIEGIGPKTAERLHAFLREN